MASAATATNEDITKPAASKKGAKKGDGSPVMAILIAVVISTTASAGVSFMLVQHGLDAAAHKAEAAAEGDASPASLPKAPPNYVPLDPAFVVNLEADDTRFLQVQVQLMTRDAKAVDILKLHEPRIRSALLMLFSQQQPSDIATVAGKQKLQAAVVNEVQKILTEETGKPLVDAAYFTSFVMQ